MPMLAEQYDYVIGGDPDRDTVDLAVLDATSAGFRAHLTQTADAAGYAQMVTWLSVRPPERGFGRWRAPETTALA